MLLADSAVTIAGLDLSRTLLAVWAAGRRLTGQAGDLYAIAVCAPGYPLAVMRGWAAAAGTSGAGGDAAPLAAGDA
jgi:hypothetical protein